MQNSLLYHCSIVKAFVKSIYIPKKWISDITAPLYNSRRFYGSGFQTVRGYKGLGFVTLKFRGFTCMQLRSTLFCSLQTLCLSAMSSEGEVQGVNNY